MNQSSKSPPGLKKALKYAERGWHVFPMHFIMQGRAVVKMPLTKWAKGDEGQRATTDPDVIRGWWKKWPDAGVGIACGPSELLVVDVDGAEGDASLASLEETLGPLPPTRTVFTTRGRHLYFKTSEGLPTSAGTLGPGIDTRGVGGFVVAPPSFNQFTDTTYRWADKNAELAPLPDPWGSALADGKGRGGAPGLGAVTRRISTSPGAYALSVLEDEIANVRQAELGERNHTLNSAAYYLGKLVGGDYLTADEVTDALTRVAGSKGLGPGEARATIASGLDAGSQEALILLQESDAVALDRDVEKELRRLQVTERARDLLRAARADDAFARPEDSGTLAEALAKPREPLSYTIDRLHPSGSNSLIAAQYKVGKTTLMANLLKSYADGDKFLGEFAVEPGAGRIAFFNYELTEDMLLDEYLAPLDIENPDRVVLLNLRGLNFDLRSPAAFDYAVKWLKGYDCDALILDPFGAAARLANDNDNSEARNWLLGVLDPLKEAAGIRDLWMPAHTGRGQAEEGAEHVRGASSVDDWADVRWLYSKANVGGDEGNQWHRFLSADGRGVDVSERELAFEKESHSLYVSEYRSRAVARIQGGVEAVARIVQSEPRINATDLKAKLPIGHRDKSGAISEAMQRGLIHVQQGPRNAKHYYPGPEASDA